MKVRAVGLLGVALTLSSVALSTVTVRTDEPKTFGAGVSLADVTPIARVLEAPATFEGKTVRVEGTVTAVCQHMGCWMALAPTDAAANAPTLRLKVDDGVIVFPVSAKGHRAAAQGVVERVKAGDAEGNEAAGEHARAEGRTADAASSGSAVQRPAEQRPADQRSPDQRSLDRWHIRVTGAVVY